MPEIELSWPAKELLPNNRMRRGGHWAGLEKAKAYKNEAYWATKSVAGIPVTENMEFEVLFYPPDKRRRDLDGMFSAMKSAIDGIAFALNVDDYCFSYKIRRESPIKGGKVLIKIS